MNHTALPARRRERFAPARRLLVALAALAVGAIAACDRDGAAASADSPGVTASDGAIDTAALRLDGVPYLLNDSIYALWRTASTRLAQLPEDRSGINPHIEHLRAIDEDDVENTIRNLESDSDARRTILSANLRVRDYIMATLALHQALSVADSASRPVRWQNVPPENIALAERNRVEVTRLRVNKRFRVVDDDPDDPDEARKLRERVRRRQQRDRDGRS